MFALLNPAAFWLDGDFQVYYEISFKNNAIFDDYFDINSNSSVFMVAISKQISDYMNLGVLFSIPYSYEIDFGTQNIETFYDPLIFESKFDRTTSEISIPINFKLNEEL